MYIQKMPLDTRNKVLLEILTRPECKEAHLEFLMNKMWNEKEVNVSQVTLKQLVVDRELASSSVLQRFLELGLPLSIEDVKMAIHCLKDDQMHLLNVKIAESNTEHFNELCQAAVDANRIPLVLNLIQKGAQIPKDCTQLILKALQFEEYDAALALARMFTKDIADHISLSSLMHPNIVNCTELIHVLLSKGVSPNNEQGKKHPIRIIMNKTNFSLSKKIELVHILLENGADCNHLCETGKLTSSTPLHKATELALKSGK